MKNSNSQAGIPVGGAGSSGQSIDPILPTDPVQPEPDVVAAVKLFSQITPLIPLVFLVRGSADNWIRIPTQQFLTNFGMTAEEFQSLEATSGLAPADQKLIADWLKKDVAKRESPLRFQAPATDGTVRSLEAWVSSSHSQLGDCPDDILVLRDATDEEALKQANQDLAQQLEHQIILMRGALDASHDGFAIWKVKRDPDGAIETFTLEFMNEAGALATGKSVDHLIGRDLEDVVGAEQSRGLLKLFRRAMAEGTEQEEVVAINSPAGWVGSFQNRVVPFAHDQLVSSYRDVSEQTRERKHLKWLAEHDYLTGLPNRGHIETYFKEVMREVRSKGTLASFVYVDIDHFKEVNDKYGHEVGDKLLVSFVKRIRNSVPESSFVGRIAGDEFALVIRDVHNLDDLKDYLDGIFQAMKRPFNTDTPELYVTCSAGAVLTDGTEGEDELMRIADRAMYQAKHDGRDCYRLTDRTATL